MFTEKQLLERKTGIGATDISAVFGLSPYKTRYQLWEEKTSEIIEEKDSPLFRYGNHMQDFIVDEYLREKDCSLFSKDIQLAEGEKIADKIFRHSNHEFILSHIDEVVINMNIPEVFLLEAKTVDDLSEKNGWGKQYTDQFPKHYLLQCAHELLVFCSAFTADITDEADILSSENTFTKVDLAAWSHGQLYIYTYHRNADLEQRIIEECIKFWELVKLNIPPEAITYEEACRKFKFNFSAPEIVASESTVDRVRKIKEIKANIKELQKVEDELKAKVCEEIGAASRLVGIDGKFLATWNESTVNRFDTEKFKTANQQMYLDYCKKTSHRTLLIK